MSVVQFPASGLTEGDYKALQGEAARRRQRGLPGHVKRGFSDTGQMWAAILRHADGPPLHQFCRDQGVYYVLYYDEGGQARVVDASRDFEEVLKHLPERSPRTRR